MSKQKKDKFNIGIVFDPDRPDVRSFTITTQLIDGQPIGGEYGMPEVMNHPLLSAIIEIPGVCAAEVHRYHAILIKGPMFEWEPIQERVLALLASLSLGLKGRLSDDSDWEDVS